MLLLSRPRSTGRPQELRGTSGLQSPTAALLSASLVQRGGRLSPAQQHSLPGGAEARRRSSFPELTCSGPRHWPPRPAYPLDLGWEKLNPFSLPQSPGEARCLGQATFSRSLARVAGNKSYEAFYPRAGNQCRARKPTLRGAGQRESHCAGGGKATTSAALEPQGPQSSEGAADS